MASPPSTEASEIRRRGRQRLIGAIAIVVSLIVFVPMILDSEPRPARNEPALGIPPKEHAPLLPSPAPAAPIPLQQGAVMIIRHGKEASVGPYSCAGCRTVEFCLFRLS